AGGGFAGGLPCRRLACRRAPGRRLALSRWTGPCPYVIHRPLPFLSGQRFSSPYNHTGSWEESPMQLPIYIKNAKPNMITGTVATGVFELFFVALTATAPSGIGRLVALPLIVVFAGLCAVFIWRYFDDRPGLVLENRGLTSFRAGALACKEGKPRMTSYHPQASDLLGLWNVQRKF